MPPAPGLTVGALLGSRAEAFGLPFEMLAGRAGLDRRITSPYIQKTGLALAGRQLGEELVVGDPGGRG